MNRRSRVAATCVFACLFVGFLSFPSPRADAASSKRHCTFQISPSSASVPAAGGSGTVAVSASTASCSWTASSPVAWITITSGSGTGSGTITYTVAPNTASTSRSATLTIAGKSFTVSQAGAACAVSFSPSSASYPTTGGSGSIAVTAAAGCSWTVSANGTWIALTGTPSGSGNGTVSYYVAANFTSQARTDGISINGQTVSVTEDAGPPPAQVADALPPLPSGGTTYRVAGDGDLQGTLNAANPNDVILLAAGATFTGNFVLPAKAGTGYILVRSDADDSQLPAAGVRMTPSYAAQLPKIQSPNNTPALRTAPGAHGYRLQFLEFPASADGSGDILDLGDGSSAQNDLSQVPGDLVVDRCYVHGTPGVVQKRGIGLNSGRTYIANSYVAEIKSTSQDSQAIAGWNGPGPYRIYNNYLEASGENFMLGGDDPKIPNLVPTDTVFAGNYVAKQIAWKGTSWVVKNLFELKNAQQVTVDRNIFEYNWQAAQAGYAIVFTPRNQNGTAPWTIVQGIQFTNNRVRRVAAVFNLLGTDNLAASLRTNTITIRNNVAEDVSSAIYGGAGRFVLISATPGVTVDHNTVFDDGSSFLYGYAGVSSGFVFTNNIVAANAYGIMGDNASPGNGTIAMYFPDGSFHRNIITNCSNPSAFPADNYYPATMNDVGFTDLAGGDYTLAPGTPYKGDANDGTDPGADVSTIPG